MTAPAGYSGTPLLKKLGVRPGATVLAIDPPPGFDETLGPLPDGAVLRGVADHTVAALGAGDPVLVFVTERARLEVLVPILREAIAPDRAAWICWPKKASKVPTDITEDVIRAVVLSTGLVDVKVCAVDATWSGLRLVVRNELR
ncbi:MAG: DUF3052 domain-containing protein [Solirubrobacteraceae bacterium]|nr:DUF3052 domain-containing protein [Patulibacter sp.]